MAENVFFWSITAADNDDADASVPWAEGMLPGSVNNSARGIMAGIARFRDDINGSITTTGSSNTYACTSNSSHTTYTNNLLITVKANHTNTGAATLNLNTYGAKSIRQFSPIGDSPVIAGQIQSGGRYQFAYDSALDSGNGAFVLLNPSIDPTRVANVGELKIWTNDTLPAGWAWSNGQALSRTTFDALYAVIGTTYGAGDGSTTFNVPDMCGRAPFGSDDMGGISAKDRITDAGSGIVGTTLGASGGAQSVTLTSNQIPSHTHAGTTASSGSHTHTAQAAGGHTPTGGTTGVSANHQHSFSYDVSTFTGGGTAAITAISGDTSRAFDITTTIETAAHTHALSADAVPDHTHTTDSQGSHTHTFTSDATGGGALHTNMPPALVVNYIIKF